MLNDIKKKPVPGFLCTHQFFPMTLQKIPSFAIFIPQPRSPFYEQLQ